ncbi:anaerobic sulfatase maturase [Lentisphaera profundi]|uniref:Anaerobic sulfatase maturase n=1 Tax=Lentisphaera profundi TaxID=1658616 RepID=A0ABY7VNE5_9BACT|nr:anaerobic sulfatase maturase [Lentisphaera profundi]WDE95266.1 anaerobic sulfatase maturase [Lentisphaera profundi]
MPTKPFHILAKPSGPICNLDCDYCFYLDKVELFENEKSFKMPPDVLEQHIKTYISSQVNNGSEINFAWQGGEPTLMGLDYFKKIVELQKKYAPAHANITNAMQTNGTLLDDEWCIFLRENNFLVGISIDGPEDLHDHYRKDKARRGTFNQVMKGLLLLQQHNVEYNTLTVVQSHNGDHPKRVYEFLKSIGSKFMQFIPIVEPTHGSKVNERSVRPKQWGDFMISIFEQWRQADIGKIFIQHFDGALANELKMPGSICVHSPECGRSLAIEHNGNVYSCDHFVYDKDLVGNIMTQSYEDIVDSPQQQQFGRDKYEKMPSKCLKCPVRPQCHGGCPAHRFTSTSNGEKHLNYLCEGYFNFFTHLNPYLKAMGLALRKRIPATEYFRFMPKQDLGRNDPCPCRSGKKYKSCHA